MKSLKADVQFAFVVFAIVVLLVMCSHSETAVSRKEDNGRLRNYSGVLSP